MSNLDIFGAAGGSAVQAEGSLPTITLGFIPLTDCAVLVVARELSFARSEGLELRLSREISWANIAIRSPSACWTARRRWPACRSPSRSASTSCGCR